MSAMAVGINPFRDKDGTHSSRVWWFGLGSIGQDFMRPSWRRRWNEHEIKQDGLDCSCGSRLTQIIFVLSGELPRVMNIIGKMHDFDFVAFIQRQPELVFAEQRFCFHCLFAFVADCLYGLHVRYGTLAVRATQAKPPVAIVEKRSARLGRLRFCRSDKFRSFHEKAGVSQDSFVFTSMDSLP